MIHVNDRPQGIFHPGLHPATASTTSHSPSLHTLKSIIIQGGVFVRTHTKIMTAPGLDSSGGGWNGNAMSQDDMMLKDTVLVLNESDDIVGSASKKESHIFSVSQPRGVLHRAFSVFLLDESTGDLLLQQRASTKITFPNVRTY